MAKVNIPSKWMDIYPKDNPQTGLFNSRGLQSGIWIFKVTFPHIYFLFVFPVFLNINMFALVPY